MWTNSITIILYDLQLCHSDSADAWILIYVIFIIDMEQMDTNDLQDSEDNAANFDLGMDTELSDMAELSDEVTWKKEGMVEIFHQSL